MGRSGVSIQAEDVSSFRSMEPLAQVVQIIEIIEPEVLTDNVPPGLVLPLILTGEMSTEYAIQDHNLGRSWNFGPLDVCRPPLPI